MFCRHTYSSMRVCHKKYNKCLSLCRLFDASSRLRCFRCYLEPKSMLAYASLVCGRDNWQLLRVASKQKLPKKVFFRRPRVCCNAAVLKLCVCVYEKYFWHNFFSLKVAEKPIFARLKWQLNAALVSFGVGGL